MMNTAYIAISTINNRFLLLGYYGNSVALGVNAIRVETACKAIRCSISETVVHKSGKIATSYFSAEREIAVWVTQFCVIMPATHKRLTPLSDNTCSNVVFTKLSAKVLTTIGALGLRPKHPGEFPRRVCLD